MKTVTKKECILLSLRYKVTVIKANDDLALVRLEKRWNRNLKKLGNLV